MLSSPALSTSSTESGALCSSGKRRYAPNIHPSGTMLSESTIMAIIMKIKLPKLVDICVECSHSNCEKNAPRPIPSPTSPWQIMTPAAHEASTRGRSALRAIAPDMKTTPPMHDTGRVQLLHFALSTSRMERGAA